MALTRQPFPMRGSKDLGPERADFPDATGSESRGTM
jgi:hypothetical protein